MEVKIIEKSKPWRWIDIKELLEYRELLLLLIQRDIKIKYAYTMVGVAWAVINPLFTLLILTFVFGTVAKIQVPGVPHAIFTLSGLLAWNYISTVMQEGGNSIVGAQNMISKIYFPRIIIPLTKVLGGLIDFIVTFVFLLILLPFYGFIPSSNIVYFPIFTLLIILTGSSIAIWLSALTIRFRDFQYVTPFIVRVGMYLTPIAYPASLVPEKFKTIFSLNPLVGVIEGTRWCFIGGDFPLQELIFSVMTVLFLMFSGVLFFRNAERVIVDIL
jgi:lipopolysaccharide transport system permease protein